MPVWRSMFIIILLLDLTSFKFRVCKTISGKDKQLRQSEIIIGDFDLLSSVLYDLPKAKWIQGTWAGIDKLLPAIDKNRRLSCIITRFTGDYFGHVMAEYVIYSIVNHERKMEEVRTNQIAKLWAVEDKISNYRVLSDLNIGIMGIGQIGSRSVYVYFCVFVKVANVKLLQLEKFYM